MDTSDVLNMETHREFERRVDDNLRAQNETICDLKSRLDETHMMAASVERLAVSMENMAKEQTRQGDDIREIRSRVDTINVEHIEITLSEHAQKLENHEERVRELELKPQDSDDHEKRIRDLEAKPAKNWERVIAGIIAGVVTFLIGVACANVWGG